MTTFRCFELVALSSFGICLACAPFGRPDEKRDDVAISQQSVLIQPPVPTFGVEWQTPLPTFLAGLEVVTDAAGFAYVLDGAYGGATVRKYDKLTGTLVWQYTVPGFSSVETGVLAYHDNRLYIVFDGLRMGDLASCYVVSQLTALEEASPSVPWAQPVAVCNLPSGPEVYGATADDTGVYVSGLEHVLKVTVDGTLPWVRPTYMWPLFIHNIAIGPGGNIYVAMTDSTDSSLSSLSRTDGHTIWIDSLAVPALDGGLAADSSGVYFGLDVGMVFLRKYGVDGTVLWTFLDRIVDEPHYAGTSAVAPDGHGGVYIGGTVIRTEICYDEFGRAYICPTSEEDQAIIARLDASAGNLLWHDEYSSSIAGHQASFRGLVVGKGFAVLAVKAHSMSQFEERIDEPTLWALQTYSPTGLGYGLWEGNLAVDATPSTLALGPGGRFFYVAGYQGTSDAVVKFTRDRDNDGLLDIWEVPDECMVDGDYDGIGDYHIPGCNPDLRDIYVECDWFSAGQFALADIQQMVNGAASTFWSQGSVTLHVDITGNLGEAPTWAPTGWEDDYYSVKDLHFFTGIPAVDAGKIKSTRYCLINAVRTGPLPQDEDYWGFGEIRGNDMVLFSRPEVADALGTGRWPEKTASLFAHELGHNLGLCHGGADATLNKPNYYSLMNYLYQFPGGRNGPFWSLGFSTTPFSAETTIDEHEVSEGDFLGFTSTERHPVLALIGPAQSPRYPDNRLEYVDATGSYEANGDDDFADTFERDLDYILPGRPGQTPALTSLARYDDWSLMNWDLSANAVWAQESDRHIRDGSQPCANGSAAGRYEMSVPEMAALMSALVESPCNASIVGRPPFVAACPCSSGANGPCYAGPPGTRGVGACHAGIWTCSEGGAWGPCTGEVAPAPEQLNGIDDDCDGVVDDIGPPTDLAVTASGPIDPVPLGQSARYTIATSNLGPNATSGLYLTISMPPQLDVAGMGVSQGSCSWLGLSAHCALGALGPNGSATVTLDGIAAASGRGEISVVVTGNEPDPYPANDTSSVWSVFGSPSADLAIVVSESLDPVPIGGIVFYTVAATNLGPSDASEVSVVDTLSGAPVVESVEVTAGSALQMGGTIAWSVGELATGGSATLTIGVRPTASGTISNLAQVSAAGPADPVSDNNQREEFTTVLGEGDRVPPITTATVDPSPNELGWNNTFPVSVTLHSTDIGGSGVARLYYKVGTGPYQSVEGDTHVVTVGDGSQIMGAYIGYYAVDLAGNVETAGGFSVRIDACAPNVNYSVSSPEEALAGPSHFCHL